MLARITERAEIARSDPAASPEQRQRLNEQVARVQELVAANRERVRTLSQAPGSLPDGGTVRNSKAPTAATQAEEVAALETRLGISLSEFDQLLLDEARRARTRGASAGGGLPGGSGAGAGGEVASRGTGAGSKAPGGNNAGDRKPAPQQTAGEERTPRIEGASTGASGAPVAPPPADVGDGADDDVVARQIRKVAESERDPQLREKLWEEYRKYKQGTKG